MRQHQRMLFGIFALLCYGCALFPRWAEAAETMPEISAACAVVMHCESGTVLYERDADKQMLIASTTKLMTALVVLEHCRLDESVEIFWEDVQVEGSAMYLRPGEQYTVEELLYGLLLVSGNDAAMALARYVAGSAESFAELMNAKAEELEMHNSHFANPHGLDAAEHYGSARDLALLMCAAMKNPDFARICGASTYSTHGVSYVNHNKLLWNCDGVIGGKTGYTQAAGRSLVTCCEREEMRLVCVTLSDPDDWADHSRLFEWAYAVYTDDPGILARYELRLPVVSGGQTSVRICAKDIPRILRRRDAHLALRVEAPRFAYAAVRAGSPAGRLVLLEDGEEKGMCPLIFAEDVPEEKANHGGLWEKLQQRVWAERSLLCRV